MGAVYNMLPIVLLLNLAVLVHSNPVPDPKIPDIHMHIYLPKGKGEASNGADYSHKTGPLHRRSWKVPSPPPPAAAGDDYNICGEIDCSARRKRSAAAAKDDTIIDVQCCST